MNQIKNQDESLKIVLRKFRNRDLMTRVEKFHDFISINNKIGNNLYFREVLSAQDRSTLILDKRTGDKKKMLMFGSNNYLNLANHPKVLESINLAAINYGTGIGGPPMLNGYTKLHRQLEERLSDIKDMEDTMIFSSGYGANLVIPQTLCTKHDTFIFDEYSHASLIDGFMFSPVRKRRFSHNDLNDLEIKLYQNKDQSKDTFVGVEGVYSMDGDMCPLNEIVEMKKKNPFILILDDAHGLGVVGSKGYGTSKHFNVEKDVDIIMGTFSKTLAMTGGFISGSKEIINFLRFFARAYIFSASLPITSVAGVLAGLDILDKEPERKDKLLKNVAYAYKKLTSFDIVAKPQAAIISIRIPSSVNIRSLNAAIHNKGIFLNSIEYPAVPVEEQRLRISFMTNHTKEDIDELVNCLEELLDNY